MNDHGMSATRVAALCVLSVLTGFALRGLIHNEKSTEIAPTISDPATEDPGPFSMIDGISVGFAPTPKGATAAAISYVSTGQLFIDAPPTQIPDLVRVYASTDTAEQQIADLLAELDALRDRLAGGQGRTRYVHSVVATSVDSFTESRCTVSLWSVGVLWRHGAAGPQAGWTTTTLDLVWELDTWRVWAESTTSGPTPAPNGSPPVDAIELDAFLDGFVTRAVRP